ncbi:MAG TPA: hypothetical protein VGM37_03495 [Armatimonadota bacterium]|jgi:hypothetical protein
MVRYAQGDPAGADEETRRALDASGDVQAQMLLLQCLADPARWEQVIKAAQSFLGSLCRA